MLNIESFECRANSPQVFPSFGKCLLDSRERLLGVGPHCSVSSEVAEIAPDIWLSVEALGLFPEFHIVAVVVEQKKPVLWYAVEQGFKAWGSPFFAVVIEHPRHLHPHSIFVDGSECRTYWQQRVSGIQAPSLAGQPH